MTMILYGRYASPFVRRVAISLQLQGRDYEHRPIMVMGEDFEKLKTINPLGRVPALILPDGEMLIETFAIMDWIDETAPEGKALIPASGPARREILQSVGYANSVVEKGVALVNDKNRRPEEFRWPEWIARLEGQIAAGLDVLEARAPESGWLGGDAPDAADIALVIAQDFFGAANPYLLEPPRPRLAALAARAAEVEAFSATAPKF